MSSSSIISVESAVRAVYHSLQAEERQAALKWLESFQNSHDAWQVSMAYLSDITSHSPEVVFFAAQILKHKVVSDLSQLDQMEVAGVMGLLQRLLSSFSLSKALRTQLLLALSAIYVQSRIELDNISDASIELLSLLPEQLNNQLIHLTEEQYGERKKTLLAKNSSAVLKLFLGALESEETRRTGVEGLQNWINFAELDSAQSVHILQVAVHLLTCAAAGSDEKAAEEDGELVGSTCEMICELVYQNLKNPGFYNSFCHYIPHLCNLLRSGAGCLERSSRKSIGSMVVETSELYLRQLISSSTAGGSALETVIPAVLKLSSDPEIDIVELTFTFWSELEGILETANPETLKEAFVPVYSDLFRALLPRLQLPSDQAQQSAEEREAFRDFRHVIGDTLKDCVRVIGSSAAIELILAALEQATRLPSWQPAEAVLFALRTITSVIDRRESERLPLLFPVILSLNSHPKLIYSTLLVIGCLSDWIRYHQESLAPAVRFIVSGLAHRGDPSISAASAMAMRYLCESCSRLMVPFADDLIKLYTGITGTMSGGDTGLDREDQLSLTESVCHIIVAAEDRARVDDLVRRAIGHHIQLLQTAISVAGEALDACLEHLSMFVELVVPESMSMIGEEWPMTGIYLHQIEPALGNAAHHHGAAIAEGMGTLLKAAVSRYSRGLGQRWLGEHVVAKLCHQLLEHRQFPTAIYALRYVVLLGDCQEAVRSLVLAHLKEHFSLYVATSPLDTLNLLTSIYDYWKGISDAVLMSHSISLCISVSGDQQMSPPELSASVVLGMRIAASSGSSADASAGPSSHHYTVLVKAILRSMLLFYPPQVQSDVATLLHRLARLGVPLEQHLGDVLRSADLAGALTDRERSVWAEQLGDALKETRPKTLKNAISSWSAAVRRRLPAA